MAKRWHRELMQLMDEFGGGTIEVTGTSHLRLRLKRGPSVVCAGSPSDTKFAKIKIRADLKRAIRSGDVQGSEGV